MKENETKIVISAYDKTQQAFTNLKANLKGIEGTFERLKGAWVGLLAAAPVVAFANMIRSVAAQGEELLKLSQAIGISVENLSGLKYAAELSETSIESLTQGMGIFSKSLAGANDEGEDTTKLLRSLGVTANDPYQALLQLADAFAGMEDGAGKTAISMKLLGRSGKDLIPLLNQGAAGLREMHEQAERAGVIMSEKAAKAADEFNDNITRLTKNLDGLKNVLANDIIHNLSRMAGVWSGIFSGDDLQIAKTKLQDIENRIAKLREKEKGEGFSLLSKSGIQAEIARLEAQKREIVSKFPKLEPGASTDITVKSPAPSLSGKNDKNSARDSALKQMEEALAKRQQTEGEYINWQAEQYRKLGISEVKTAEWKAVEIEKLEQKHIVEKQKLYREDAQNWSESMAAELNISQEEQNKLQKIYEDGHKKRMELLNAQREAEIQLELSRIDFKEQGFEISKGDAAQQRLALYKELLVIQQEYQSELGKQGDTSGWYAQAQAIEDTRLRLLELNAVIRDETGSALEGVAFSLNQYVRQLNTTFQKTATVTQKTINGMEGAFTAFFDHTSESFLKLGDLAIKVLGAIADAMMQQFVVQTIVGGISQLVGGMFGPGASSLVGAFGNMAAGNMVDSPTTSTINYGGYAHSGKLIRHSGGYIPRFHARGLESNERMTINKVGERYITEEQNSWLTNIASMMKNGSTSGETHYHYHINALDPQSWKDFARRNPGPILDEVARDARMGGQMSAI